MQNAQMTLPVLTLAKEKTLTGKTKVYTAGSWSGKDNPYDGWLLGGAGSANYWKEVTDCDPNVSYTCGYHFTSIKLHYKMDSKDVKSSIGTYKYTDHWGLTWVYVIPSGSNDYIQVYYHLEGKNHDYNVDSRLYLPDITIKKRDITVKPYISIADIPEPDSIQYSIPDGMMYITSDNILKVFKN